jgi:acetyltransferase/esterase
MASVLVFPLLGISQSAAAEEVQKQQQAPIPSPPSQPAVEDDGSAVSATPKAGFLKVSGARLYYEVAGSGPTLLLIHAGTGEADDWNGLRSFLTRHYRVVTYDRRGSSRSTLTRPAGWITVRQQADDAAALLRHVGGGPAHVVGSSGGGTVLLELTARYPRLLRTVVAHEPAVCEMGGPRECARVQKIGRAATAVYRITGDAQLGMLTFILGVNDEDEPEPGAPPPPTLDPERAARLKKNDGFFLSHEIREFLAYRLPVAEIGEARHKIVIIRGQYAAPGMKKENAKLAEALGTSPPLVFPGGHTGYVIHPEQFAAQLRTVLG